MNKYQFKAIKTQVNGVWYDSVMEANVAKLLLGNKIGFVPHRTFKVFDRKGNPFFYEVDFFLETPQSFAGIPTIVRCLEVKGVLSKRDIHRVEALNYCHFYRTWVVTNALIVMWQKEGMFWTEKDMLITFKEE